MNKIYKIIWSKTVGAYVVTSELAKSHTKNPSRKELRRSIAAALMAAMVAAPVSFGVYAAGDTHYVSVKSNNQTADSNYDNQGAQAENSIAIGPSVKTTGEDKTISLSDRENWAVKKGPHPLTGRGFLSSATGTISSRHRTGTDNLFPTGTLLLSGMRINSCKGMQTMRAGEPRLTRLSTGGKILSKALLRELSGMEMKYKTVPVPIM